jgi:hypothetical protein
MPELSQREPWLLWNFVRTAGGASGDVTVLGADDRHLGGVAATVRAWFPIAPACPHQMVTHALDGMEMNETRMAQWQLGA